MKNYLKETFLAKTSLQNKKLLTNLNFYEENELDAFDGNEI